MFSHKSSCHDLFFQRAQRLHGTLQTNSYSFPSLLNLSPLCFPKLKKDSLNYNLKTKKNTRNIELHLLYSSNFLYVLVTTEMHFSIGVISAHICVQSEKLLCLSRHDVLPFLLNIQYSAYRTDEALNTLYHIPLS